jgi:hypothetical protein
MTNITTPGPVEVWLTQNNMQVTCRVIHEDETAEELDVNSLSMRGAQREVTGWFLSDGYTPVGRWEAEVEGEAVRRFRPAP